MTLRATLGWLAVVGLAAGLVMGFGVAPREATQGNVQRIMYLHVPAVWAAYLGFVAAAAASVTYLFTRMAGADRLAYATIEVGLVFLGLNIATGMIWGKPTWGVWWAWDARITSVSVVFLMYLGYLLLRLAVEDQGRAARYGAVLAILGAPSIFLVHRSVDLWRTLHQPASLMKAGGPTMPTIFWLAIVVNFLGFALLGAYFVTRRVAIMRREAESVA